MARDTFPNAGSRRVIADFLHGEVSGVVCESARLTSHAGGLYLTDAPTTRIAWYNPDGSIHAAIHSGDYSSIYAALVVEALTQALYGAASASDPPPPVLTRQPVAPTQTGILEPPWAYAGRVLTPGEPFVLAGPLTVLAYRATVKTPNAKTPNAKTQAGTR